MAFMLVFLLIKDIYFCRVVFVVVCFATRALCLLVNLSVFFPSLQIGRGGRERDRRPAPLLTGLPCGAWDLSLGPHIRDCTPPGVAPCLPACVSLLPSEPAEARPTGLRLLASLRVVPSLAKQGGNQSCVRQKNP